MIKEGFENRFSKGDVVYWCEREGGRLFVDYGIVEEQFFDGVYINLLSLKERRRVNGIPLDEFKNTCTSSKRKKLPRGWNYNTQLYELTTDAWTPEEEKILQKIDITDPKQIREAYDKGILVERAKIFTGDIYEDITNEGYRIVTKCHMWETYRPTRRTIRSDKVYFTYKEAEAEKDANIEELKRQAELSDEEWSWELIKKDVERYSKLYWGIHYAEKINQYLEFFKNLPNIEDIETRFSGGTLQWKYCKNKAWKNVFIPD